MYAVRAIYEGNHFKLEEQPPVQEKYEVIITFTKPVKHKQEDLLSFFNMWNEDDAACMEEIIKEREHFSLGRTEL